jgi:hypothetical protein
MPYLSNSQFDEPSGQFITSPEDYLCAIVFGLSIRKCFHSEDVATRALVACTGNGAITFVGHAPHKNFHLFAHAARGIARIDLASVSVQIVLLLTDAVLAEFRDFHLRASGKRENNATKQHGIFHPGIRFPIICVQIFP